MPDFTKTYGTLAVQPIDLINAFKLDFCFASVIKWLTKWHMERKHEDIVKAQYYNGLCVGMRDSTQLRFAIRMYCQLNGFIARGMDTCLLMDVTSSILSGHTDRAASLMDGVG